MHRQEGAKTLQLLEMAVSSCRTSSSCRKRRVRNYLTTTKCLPSLKLEFNILCLGLSVLESNERLTDRRMVFPSDACVPLVARLAD